MVAPVLLACFLQAASVDQAAVDKLASCWRDLRHEHGGPVPVAYVCDQWYRTEGDCHLTVSTCEYVTIPAQKRDEIVLKGTGSFNFTLELQRGDSQFRVMIKDHLSQGLFANGTIGDTVVVPKRHLGVQGAIDSLHLPFHVDANWRGWAQSYLYGMRRDCTVEKCPERWKECWVPDGPHSMLQLQVFVLMHASFCDHFNSIAQSEEYVVGLFRDVNLIFEEQIGVSLRLAFLMPPDMISLLWPEIVIDGGNLLETFSDTTCNTDQFKRQIGRSVSDFGVFHILVGGAVWLPEQKHVVGRANFGNLCECRAISWSAYMGDRETKLVTWATMAHEIAHNFGGAHYFDHANREKNDPDAGLLGYGFGTVKGVFAFNDANKEEICATVQKYSTGDFGSGCFLPYFGHAELDPRFGMRYEVIVAILVILSLITLCSCSSYIYTRRKQRAEFDDRQTRFFTMDVQEQSYRGRNTKCMTEKSNRQDKFIFPKAVAESQWLNTTETDQAAIVSYGASPREIPTGFSDSHGYLNTATKTTHAHKVDVQSCGGRAFPLDLARTGTKDVTRLHLKNDSLARQANESSPRSGRHAESASRSGRKANESSPLSRHAESSPRSGIKANESSPRSRHAESSPRSGAKANESSPRSRHAESSPRSGIKANESSPRSGIKANESSPRSRHAAQNTYRKLPQLKAGLQKSCQTSGGPYVSQKSGKNEKLEAQIME